MLLVPRTCVRQSDTKGERAAEPTPLRDTRALSAYVLLGDPGLGKSEAFRQEADAGRGCRISASDLVALDHAELKGSTLPLFIDGLDETRAGTIEDLSEQVRHSDLNLNHQYWNDDSHKKATTPRHEERCRDTFADQLRVRLERFGIACLPETHHADGKRSDVWCTAGTVSGVPIEVKRDRHRELWSATRGQLMARYASDPRAKGRGIYVVLWFGDPMRIPRSPSVVRPQTPDELQAMLEAGLSEEEKRSITIHVLDCSVRGK